MSLSWNLKTGCFKSVIQKLDESKIAIRHCTFNKSSCPFQNVMLFDCIVDVSYHFMLNTLQCRNFSILPPLSVGYETKECFSHLYYRHRLNKGSSTSA